MKKDMLWLCVDSVIKKLQSESLYNVFGKVENKSSSHFIDGRSLKIAVEKLRLIERAMVIITIITMANSIVISHKQFEDPEDFDLEITTILVINLILTII